ncbi:unnamed protein product [marine sediment metagenome]|uniref:Uncharacterized protein n=1 Tax=marine sediment metagenome TaxID=412755 RepID=X1BFQ2_9ZZZZ
MKLEKAIELVTNLQITDLPLPRHQEWVATQLLIEAGKAIKLYQEGPMGYLYCLLPGQTKE